MRLVPSLKIAQKLPLILIGSVLLAGLGIGIAAFIIGLETVKAQRQEALRASVHASFNQVTDYFAVLETDLTLMASRADTVGALDVLAYAFTKESFTGASAEALQAAYIDGNPNPLGQRFKFDSAERAGKGYDTQHRRYHPAFRDLMVARGYADVLLFDASGNLVYSAAKEADFALNFAAGSDLAKTGLGQALNKARTMPAGIVSFVDFSSYSPVAGGPRAFAATGIFKDSVLIGVAAIAIAPDGLTTRLQSVKGLGKTGEVLIVGKDNLLRTDSVFSDSNDVLATALPPDLLASAINGAGSTPAALGYRGIPLSIASLSFGFKGVKWQIVAVQSEEEILAPVITMGTTMLAIGGGFLLLAAAAGFWFTRSITKPVTRLTRSMGAIAGGNLDTAVAGAKRRDELGAMARAVEVFRENAIRVGEMTEGERAASIQRRQDRAAMMAELQTAFGEVVDAAVSGDFSRRVTANFPDEELNALARSVNLLVETVDRGVGETGEVLAALAATDLTRRMEGDYEGAFAKLKNDTNAVVDALGSIVGQLHQTSRALKIATGEILSGSDDLAKRTSKQAATIEKTSTAMRMIAEMVLHNADRASEASSNAAAVTRTAEEGGSVMNEANDAMERITTSSGKISNIIGLIDDIAFQTNLLALNASVEAARAGEAGKGFAVVAVEVRRLAQSAAEASRDVKVLIEQSASDVRGGSKYVAEAAGKLGAMLEAARANTQLIEGIAQESRKQASAIEEVNRAVRTMDEMTQHNAALVEETNAAIEKTETQARELDRIVEVFTTQKQDAATAIEDEQDDDKVAA